MSVPGFLPQQFREVVLDHGVLHLRTGTVLDTQGGKLRVVATLPLDQNMLDRVSGRLGQIVLYALEGSTRTTNSADKSLAATPNEPFKSDVSGSTTKKPDIVFTGSRNGTVWEGKLTPLLTAGALPDGVNLFDQELGFPSPLFVLNMDTGKREYLAVLRIHTRPSLLFRRLFTEFGEVAPLAEFILLATAVLFTVIVLLALFIGARLDLTMTRSVANLYTATQHLNRGEFGYRIEVRERDQIAELQTSFNSMAASIEKLMLEQREKQRLENEITIAQEVQAQLFPQQVSQLESLEVHGFCKPARTVSGDYYDFLPITTSKLGLAVGDISGKGISAALLMATIHSAVRAYMLEGVPSSNAPLLVGGGNDKTPGNGHFHGSEISPAALMCMLNRQLYSTTPMEKYATLFLGLYDGAARCLTYSNAGHLPPILLGEDGCVRRLETGGTVVGLFDDVRYEEGTVSLKAGEIFLAFSDGVTEPENDYGEFGEDRLIELVQASRHLPLDRISDLVTNAVYEWIGDSEQPDDITLVLARAR
jgi:sigma-B regulation protein RsbU (phosphoserine phosphatase)